jgi:hypothetical protein
MAVTTGAVTAFGQATVPAAPPAAVTTSGPALPPAGAMPDPNQPIAIINGLPINNKAFNDILMQVAGMRVFQQVFDLSLIQKACLDAGIAITGDEFTKRLNDELDKTMTGLGIVSTTTQPMTMEQRTGALSAILQQQGVTAVEFRLGLETRAALRAMSEGKFVVPTDAEIKDAYDSEYGERRKVHIIQYPDTQSVVAIKAALKTAKTPEDAAKDLKLPAPAVWVISKNATSPNVKAIRDVAFDSLKVIGEVSAETEVPGANGQKQKVLVILDEITKDRTSEVKFDDKTKEEYRKKVYDFKQVNWMNNHLVSLRSRASVDIKDPLLSDQFKQIADAMQRQAAAAATQPGGATGTAPAPTTAPASAPATRLTPSLVAPTGRGN